MTQSVCLSISLYVSMQCFRSPAGGSKQTTSCVLYGNGARLPSLIAFMAHVMARHISNCVWRQIKKNVAHFSLFISPKSSSDSGANWIELVSRFCAKLELQYVCVQYHDDTLIQYHLGRGKYAAQQSSVLLKVHLPLLVHGPIECGVTHSLFYEACMRQPNATRSIAHTCTVQSQRAE